MTTLRTPANWLAGYIPDLPTPFHDNGDLDLKALARLCEFQIEAGVSAIVVGETAGEASTLTPDEHDRIVHCAVEAAGGRIHIIAGAGSNSTSHAVELTRRAAAAGAQAVLSVVPYYNKPMQSGIYAHFRAIADSTALPVILHDIPSRTVRGLSDETLAQLAASKQFIGLRDGTGEIGRLGRLQPLLPREFRLLSGDDATALAYLAAGGHGCISAISNVAPELCREIYANCEQGRLRSARRLFNRLVPLASLLAGEHPAALKYALSLLGSMQPTTRSPIVQLNETTKAAVANAIAALANEVLVNAEDASRAMPVHDHACNALPDGRP
jgi:4-hydroxy-tetrahydrodipicolinate synthase